MRVSFPGSSSVLLSSFIEGINSLGVSTGGTEVLFSIFSLWIVSPSGPAQGIGPYSPRYAFKWSTCTLICRLVELFCTVWVKSEVF